MNGAHVAREAFIDSKQPSFADMSSAQRSASMDATVAQVDALTRVTNAQLTREHEYNALTGAQGQRIAALEFDTALLKSSFTARLRWFLTGS